MKNLFIKVTFYFLIKNLPGSMYTVGLSLKKKKKIDLNAISGSHKYKLKSTTWNLLGERMEVNLSLPYQ